MFAPSGWQRFGRLQVYIRERHHNVLEAWRETATRVGRLHLVTFDSHADTLPAFHHHVSREFMREHSRKPTTEERDAASLAMVAATNWADDRSFFSSLRHLSHDEHIDAARHAGYLDQVFLISGVTALPPTPGWAKVFLPVESQRLPAADWCARLLEDDVLNPIHQNIFTSIGGSPFVLDIDLDCFRTTRALRPLAGDTFLSWARAASVVTIAQEPDCVASLRLPGEDHLSSDLQGALAELLARA